jgi:dTDP-4-dehydrorhamnose 3,5-epimerase
VKIIETPLEGVTVIEPDRFEDERGWFMEVWNEVRYRAAGLKVTFAQDNVSFSRRGVLRGMHYQTPHEQGKLICALSGAIFDAVVDVRRGSPTFGNWYGCELSTENGRQLWVPEGYAHGFLVRSEEALVHYNSTVAYHAESDRTLAWNDPDVGIDWPEVPRLVSIKDASAPMLKQLASHQLPSRTRPGERQR